MSLKQEVARREAGEPRRGVEGVGGRWLFSVALGTERREGGREGGRREEGGEGVESKRMLRHKCFMAESVRCSLALFARQVQKFLTISRQPS